MGIGLRKLALVGAALLAGGFAVAGDALAQGGPTTQSFPTTRPLGHPGARPPAVRPPGVRPPVARPPITNPGFPGRPPGWQRPPHGGHWGHRPPHYRPPMVRPRPHCVVQYRIVPSPYGPVRRPVRVCY
ncbi:hypothetical protein [Methylocella sp. CPCC 101449]|jgi:hypothetical protein|uniref:hypothetical protein n=1 Tax=Methylocella sp. CPCC 101449 TaxID=2987531 RepID=UPI00288F5213|nr:hypothetical protein [Methylocella sp. CPCC 101449]MDT2022958.1 hypothetical protein [Methylocella sp. CPCC 101449]HEV2570391.1 hypothetical protein [Beijerinckiaceae bacterium]